VICLGKKLICRSGGLVEKAEMMSHHIRRVRNPADFLKQKLPSKSISRNQDTAWLNLLKIRHIIDFMNETTKSMFGINLCSGEGDALSHIEFPHNAMPYPGVESYKGFRNLVKEGKLPFLRAKNEKNKLQANLKISLEFPLLQQYDYRNWDIVTLTRKYMVYIFHILRSDDKGLLLHCISGWDRTPLWIGILRILLWADGLAHRSLDAEQITYLVIAYDWLLFGHQLSKRLKEHSEILYCAFWLLQHLTDEIYSFNYTETPEHEDLLHRRYTAQRSVSSTNVKKSSSPSSLIMSNKIFDKSSTQTHGYKVRDLSISEDSSSLSAPNFNYYNPHIELDIFPQNHKFSIKEPTEREKRILDVWELFRKIYVDIVDHH